MAERCQVLEGGIWEEVLLARQRIEKEEAEGGWRPFVVKLTHELTTEKER